MRSSLSSFVDYHSEENRKVDGKRERESKEIQKLTAVDYTIYILLIEFQADIYFINNNIITSSR